MRRVKLVVKKRRCVHSTRRALEGRNPAPLFSEKDIQGQSPDSKAAKMFKGQVNYFPDFIHWWTPQKFKIGGCGLAAGSALCAYALGTFHILPATATVVTGLYWYVGMADINQTRHSIRRNFPILGRMRYLFEVLRPEIYQYFVESDQDGRPFSREQRSQAYQRSKNIDATMPFGTRKDVYAEGYEWMNHSLWPKEVGADNSRTVVGAKYCARPYSAALLNVSAMSYGALSDNAILALNKGAKLGGFSHNTGEGGISRFHLEPSGDLVWNIGTGYFGCRSKDGRFDLEMFIKNATQESVKMIEIKLSQGAKPAHGGMLPKEKITEEIARARGLGLPPYTDCNSPPMHSAFRNPHELASFISTLREASGGKPVGFKLCVGRPDELAAIVRAFVEVGGDALPDFITVDGGEGGTGAAPPEFTNRLGAPLYEGITLVDAMLRGANLRDDVKIIASGRVVNGFDLVRTLALGADFCNSARAMMFALGCIQALQCNTNKCPTGIATSKKRLMRGLDVDDKGVRVQQYQAKTVHAALEIVGACGLSHHSELKPYHVRRRVNGMYSETFSNMYPEVATGSLLTNNASEAPPEFSDWWERGGALLNSMRTG
eukprot:g951.t1